MKPSVIVYDNQMKKRAILENAFKVGYEKKLNELWTASFSLPANDPKNEECEVYRYVEIYDQGERVELFRILPIDLDKQEESSITYHCEHVLATLMDDVLFQYHEIGGVGIYTTTVLQYILSKQSQTKWVLGRNDFNRQFLYKWENDNLLGSLFSVPKPFLESYMWTWNTTIFPWVLDLVQIEDEVKSYVRYKKNMRAINRTEDPTELCTRLYCLGYGEGVNQLTINRVNNGKPYLDAPTINRFGVIARIFVDRRFEDEESLMARGQVLLNELQIPRLTYEVDAADISSITNDPVDKFQIGTFTRVIDTDLRMNVKALVSGISKTDITGNPGDMVITIANKPKDIATSVAELADRQRINEVYSQGATNLDTHDFLDNCDPNYPAILKFYIPEETVRINKMTLSYESMAFRAFSRAIEGGGAFADTTQDGGGFADVTQAGGGVASSTAAGGGVGTTTASGGGTSRSTSTESERVRISTISVGSLAGSILYTDFQLSDANKHSHQVENHSHILEVDGHRHDVSIPNHQHELSIPNHQHNINIPNHSHMVQIPNHKHNISLPNHIHQIEYGIFQGPTPTSLEVKIDGKVVPGLGLFETDVNIIPYLSKDGGGRVRRGWHTVEIKPNRLGRIAASVVMQCFVQSRGGGDY